jgi:hypothetical protein
MGNEPVLPTPSQLTSPPVPPPAAYTTHIESDFLDRVLRKRGVSDRQILYVLKNYPDHCYCEPELAGALFRATVCRKRTAEGRLLEVQVRVEGNSLHVLTALWLEVME